MPSVGLAEGRARHDVLFQQLSRTHFLLTCKNKTFWSFTSRLKGRRHKCPASFDGLIDIQPVPDSSLITQAQTSVCVRGGGGGWSLTHASSNKQASPCCCCPLGNEKPFVLVIVITVCRKHKSAKFINRNDSEALAK